MRRLYHLFVLLILFISICGFIHVAVVCDCGAGGYTCPPLEEPDAG